MVRSMRPFTMRALVWSESRSSGTSITGVEITLEALMISLMRGTPRVTFMEAMPAKWNVLSVICVPGSPMLWAPIAPTALPGSILARRYLRKHSSRRCCSCRRVMKMPGSTASALSRFSRSAMSPHRYRKASNSSRKRCEHVSIGHWAVMRSASGRRDARPLALRNGFSVTFHLSNTSAASSLVRWGSRLRATRAQERSSIRRKLIGRLSSSSMSAGSSPSSPYRNCTMPPWALRTEPS
mmetsp:Transcript_966/g.2072  ORF Transcript_966/g.2072 Transcript_966/m.2072 type:complete len:239 (-) Transcript_966:2829-3545(-)